MSQNKPDTDQWARPKHERYHPESSTPFGTRLIKVPNEVSTMQKCPTSKAMTLCILELDMKVIKYGEYNIGGTYTNDELDLWFYYTTSYCPQDRCLLSLFVCFSKKGSYDIGVGKSSDLYHTYTPADNYPRRYFPFILEWQVFTAHQPNDKFFIKAYSIRAELLYKFGWFDTLCIPIKIVKPKCHLDKALVRSIKLKHDLRGLMNNKEETDLTVYSSSGNQYHVHKMVFAANGNFREQVISGAKSLTLDISDDQMKVLLGFMYTGTVEDTSSDNRDNLIEIAKKFELANLLELTESIPIKILSEYIAVGTSPVSYIRRVDAK